MYWEPFTMVGSGTQRLLSSGPLGPMGYITLTIHTHALTALTAHLMTSPRPEALHTLAETVRTRLRSSQILTSLPQVVSELVQNALDASASHIDVGVDCQEWECWVKDDGHGISKSGLELLSKNYEAGRYSMSLPNRSHAPSRAGFEQIRPKPTT